MHVIFMSHGVASFPDPIWMWHGNEASVCMCGTSSNTARSPWISLARERGDSFAKTRSLARMTWRTVSSDSRIWLFVIASFGRKGEGGREVKTVFSIRLTGKTCLGGEVKSKSIRSYQGPPLVRLPQGLPQSKVEGMGSCVVFHHTAATILCACEG